MSASKQEKGRPDLHRETLDEEVQRPLQKPVTFSLAVSTTFDHSDPPEFRRYRLSHCFPSIGVNAANSEIRRLAYIGQVVTTISLAGSSRTG